MPSRDVGRTLGGQTAWAGAQGHRGLWGSWRVAGVAVRTPMEGRGAQVHPLCWTEEALRVQERDVVWFVS